MLIIALLANNFKYTKSIIRQRKIQMNAFRGSHHASCAYAAILGMNPLGSPEKNNIASVVAENGTYIYMYVLITTSVATRKQRKPYSELYAYCRS